jgi:predicted DCC family thiol-disulfide oxidoreductase YuxK
VVTEKIVLYDGDCNLCHGFVRFIQKHDRKSQFRFISLQSDQAKELLKSAGFNQPEMDSVIYLENNQTYLKSEAFFRITHQLGDAFKFIDLFSIFPRRLTDRIYDLIAKNRHILSSRKATCKLPIDQSYGC